MRLFIITLDGTSSISYSLPRDLIQTIVNEAVATKDWKRLHILFLGGGGEKQYSNGSGGLAMGCDASNVPLEDIIRCDFSNLRTFINILLEHKANANPQKGSREDLVDVAIQLEKFDVASLLMDKRNKTGADVKTSANNIPQVKLIFTFLVIKKVLKSYVIIILSLSRIFLRCPSLLKQKMARAGSSHG